MIGSGCEAVEANAVLTEGGGGMLLQKNLIF